MQVIIESSIRELELKYKYKIPYYYLKEKPFCYLNVTKDYVDVGFNKGNQISVHQDQLVTENRKIIKSLRYKRLEDIDSQILEDVLITLEHMH